VTIAILHNRVPEDASASDRDVLVQVQAVASALAQVGHATAVVPCDLDLRSLQQQLQQLQPVAVFNLVESLAGSDSLMFLVTALLDRMNLPYTGSPTEAIFLTNHKLLAKQRLSQADLPTPAWFSDTAPGLVKKGTGTLTDSDLQGRPLRPVVEPVPALKKGAGTTTDSDLQGRPLRPVVEPVPALKKGTGTTTDSDLQGRPLRPVVEPVPFFSADPLAPAIPPGTPFVIKAVSEHASLGLDEHSLVTVADQRELRQHLRDFRLAQGRPGFAEQFIGGREFNISLLAGDAADRGAADCGTAEEDCQVLPAAEIDFSAFPTGKPHLVGYRAKWEEDSFEYQNTPRTFDFPPQDGPLLARIGQLACACWRLFGTRGYARVDFRVDEAGQPWILEVNANPCLSPDAGFAAALQRAGIAYHIAIARILDAAR
jgi:D-alanine-D-alanine ligase